MALAEANAGRDGYVYSPILKHVRISDIVRFTPRAAGQPRRDLADVLASKVILDSAMELSCTDDFATKAAHAWSVQRSSACRELAEYKSGIRRVSRERIALLRLGAKMDWIVSMPWEALHPRVISALQSSVPGIRNGDDTCPIRNFWWALCEWRRALGAERVETLLRRTDDLLSAIGPMARSHIMKSYTIEFIDVVDRVLDVLPAQLLPLSLTFSIGRTALFDDEEAKRLLSARGIKPSRVSRRWRHLRWSRSLFIPLHTIKHRSDMNVVAPWHFMDAKLRESMLAQSRNEHIDFAMRTASW